ncbi:g12936 [Coccomyxa viridis]|uniref:G12936 protein n=1 Tax=Coccomyxa viridis TaxID=1274662 RepID=A0ABP1GBK3_9CHLO
MAMFSYRNPTPFAKQLEEKLHVVIKQHDSKVALLHFEEREEGKPAKRVPVPSKYQLIFSATNKRAGSLKSKDSAQPRCFIIASHQDYHLTRKGDGIVLKITNPREQMIE